MSDHRWTSSLAPSPSNLTVQALALHDIVEILVKDKTESWWTSLELPPYMALCSAIILLLHAFIKSRRVRRLWARLQRKELPPDDFFIEGPSPTSPQVLAGQGADITGYVEQHAGRVIFAFHALRLVSSVSMLLLSVRSAFQHESHTPSSFGRTGKHRWIGNTKWTEFLLVMTYIYTSLLAALAIVAVKWTTVSTRHLNVILLALCGMYLYRDVYPFAKVNGVPADKAEGPILWVKLVIITFGAIFIPLAMPARYVPVESTDPMDVPSPEQTASLFSFLTFSFLDPLIKHANQVPALPADALPPLPDYDRARHLKSRAFPHIDMFTNGNKRHLFFGLMRIFRKEYAIMTLSMIVHTCANFASPLGIQNLLEYLETGGPNSEIKPWFWILWLLLGPFLSTTADEIYTYVTTHTLVQAEGIMTQLLFEHSLRIRVKAEASSDLPSEEITTLNSESQDAGDKMEDEDAGEGKNFVGRINNLVTTDLENITEARDFLFVVLYIPLEITLCVVFLYSILGWSALVGLATMIALAPIPGYLAKLNQDVQVARMEKTDARVQSVTETLNILRMVKLFGWEKKMASRIGKKREEELSLIWKRELLGVMNDTVNYLIPLAVMTATFATFTLGMKEDLTASIVFSSMTVFDMFQNSLHLSFYYVNSLITGRVSLNRVNDFLTNTELLDTFRGLKDSSLTPHEGDHIGFHNASFTWSNKTAGGALTPSRRFTLCVEGNLFFPRGQLSLVTGPTGSGKTSLLMALLGEMHFVPAPGSWFSLPRAGGVAYAAQESWVQNETIKQNILFGAAYDQERYQKVIYQCGLTRDLSLFEAGDETEVGEKGLTLSGGQKARVTLARAVYSKAEILLLDDVLAALDVHTSKWIVEKCLLGDLVKGRTVVMVTHNVALASTAARFVVSLGNDGKIMSQGPPSNLPHRDEDSIQELNTEQGADKIPVDEGVPDSQAPKPASGKLIVAEEMEEGHVSWEAFKMYLSALGGNHRFLTLLGYFALLLVSEATLAGQTWFLGYWASQYSLYPSFDVPVIRNIAIYSGMVVIGALAYGVAFLVVMKAAIRASRAIHTKLLSSVLGTTLRWLDTTPVSRIMARCTEDIDTVDDMFPMSVRMLTSMTVTMLIKLTAVMIFTPAFLLPTLLVAAGGGYCGQLYMKAQLSVKREMSNAKQPVLGHFGTAIAGLTSLRAYGAQSVFIEGSLQRIDRYSRAARVHYNLSRWATIRMNLLGSFFAAGLATYLVYVQGHNASNTGFSLNMAVGFSGMILWWIHVFNDFEVEGNSLERIDAYVHIEQEEKPSEHGIPPAFWPADGSLHVENLSARYSTDGPEVLHNISFDLKAGERIGIVGRTGSGKSSLTLALLRCIPTEGTVVYAGRDTRKMNLDALRTNLTIIPQMPELLSGSLRQNLDPFDQYDDAALNAALTSAGLFSLQSKDEEGRITLDSSISSGGGNLSVGQRQIIALARAIVRGSKLLILDEATSAIDHNTDAVIQSSLRNELASDVTVLTVAHRLHTIMDSDRIMVLDAGHIVEFDKPSHLLTTPKSLLRALVNESGDKEALEEMARL